MTVKNSERQTINETKMKYWYSHVICCSPIMILAFIMLSVFIVLGTKETVKAATEPSATFDAETGTLTISGTFSGSGSDVANKIMRLSGTSKSNVKKVIAESGTVFGYSCSSLFEEYTNCTEIDLSNANTDHVETMYGMFQDCTKLETLKLNNFNTSKVSTMASMFENCSNLTELDLSSFDTSYVKNMDRMFAYCSALKTIYVSESFVTTQLTSGDFIFSRCNSIVGGNGTKYQAFEYNVTYARIDKAGSPGYFTKKHVHSFSYSSSGNVLTAECGESDCHLTDSSISLTLTPPTSVTDAEHTAVTLDGLEDFNSETGQNISQDDITYYNTSGGSKTGDPLGSVPVTAGTYCAELTVSRQTASLIYDLNLAPTANTLTYTGSSQVLITDGSAADGYAFQYRLGTDGAWSPTPPTETEAGEYAVYYYLSNTSDSSQNIGSEGSPYGSIPVTIAKADAALTTEPVGNTGLTYDGNAQELLTTEGAASGGTVYYRLGTGGTWTTTPPQETTAGNYTIYYYVVGDSNHSDLGSTTDPLGSVTARMEKKSLRVKAQDQTITYGNQISQDSANYVLSTEVAAGDSASVKLTQSIPARKITPSVTVRRNGVDVSNCYAIVRMSGYLTVNPTTLTVTADAKLKYYLQDDPALTYGVSGLGYSDKASSVLTGALTRGSEEALGTYAITQGNLAIAQGYTDFYNLTFQGADFTISAKPVASVTIRFVSEGGLETDNYSMPYTGTAIEPTIKVYDGETLIPANEYTVAYTNNTSASTDTTKASVTVTDNADGNYILTETSANFTITKTPASLDTEPTGNYNLTYNGSAQCILTTNGTATNGTLYYRLGETGEWTTTPPQVTAADDYTVYYFVEGDENHSDLGSTTDPLGSVTARIAKATVTVSGIIAQNKEYDENTVASFDDSLTMTGAVPTEELQVNVEGVFADSKPGNDKTVTITNVTLSGATKENYTVSYDTTATLTASITIADGTTLTETVTQPDGTVVVTETTYQNNTPDKMVVTSTTTSEDGKTETVITKDASGNVVSTVETFRDKNGNVVNTIETKKNADGITTVTTTDGSTTTIENKDASGNTIKTIKTKNNSDGSTTVTETTYDLEGNNTGSMETTTSADGKTEMVVAKDGSGNTNKTVETKTNADETTIVTTTEGSTTMVETKDALGNTTKTVETKTNTDGTTTVTTAEGSSTTVETKDASGNITKTVETNTNSDGSTTVTEISYDSEGNVTGSTETTTSADGKTEMVVTKDGSGKTTKTIEIKTNADGATTVTTTEESTTTVETKDASGNTTKVVVRKTNANGTTIVTTTEGSTTTVETKDTSGNTTKVVETKTNADGTTITTTEESTTTVETKDASGNTTKTIETKNNADGTTIVTIIEGSTTNVQTKDGSGNTIKTVETKTNTDGTTTVTTTEGSTTTVETKDASGNTTRIVETKKNADGTTTVTTTEGSLTTVETKDVSGNVTKTVETKTNEDGTTTVTTTEGNTTTVETKDASDNTTNTVEIKKNTDGATTVTTTEGSTTKVETKDAAGNTTKAVETKTNEDGTTTVTTTEGSTTKVETKDAAGNTTKTVEINKNADGTSTVTTTEGNKTTVETKNENNKIVKKVETTKNSDGTTTVTETLYNSEGNKTGSTETTTSADGKTETVIKKDAEGNIIEDTASGSGEEKTDESGKNPAVVPGEEKSGNSGNEPKNESGDKTNTDKSETKPTASDATKNEINTKLNDLIIELKKVIDSLENLTDEQKAEANKKLDSVVDIAKNDVSNAASDNAAQSVLDNAVVETKSIVVGAVTKDIQKQADNAKAEIDNTKGLTNSQKKALKAEVDSKANEAVASAVKSIDSIATNTVSKSNADTASQTSANTGSTAKENADTIKAIKSDISEKIGEAKTDAKVQAAINKYATPKQIEKNSFSLNEGLKVDQKGKKITVKWGTVSDADGYDIYVQYCGKKFTKKAGKTVKKSSSDSAVITKIGGKKLNVKKNFKVYVNAYKKVSGKKITLGTSITAHVVGVKNKKYTNAKDIKITSHTKIDVYIGTKYRITADTILVDSKKKQLSDAHAKEFRYASTDKSIATVSKDGYITGKKAGEVIIWVYARNGYGKRIQVTVK